MCSEWHYTAREISWWRHGKEPGMPHVYRNLTTCSIAISHYGDVIMGAIASQITSLTIVYSTVYSDADQRRHQSFASLAFVRGFHRGYGLCVGCEPSITVLTCAVYWMHLVWYIMLNFRVLPVAPSSGAIYCSIPIFYPLLHSNVLSTAAFPATFLDDHESGSHGKKLPASLLLLCTLRITTTCR